MGRPPKPTALKAIEGGRGHRTKAEKAKEANEPRPPRDCPACPSWLDARAKRKWASLCGVLNEMGVLTLVDGDYLACYCDAYSRLLRYTAFLRKNGDTTTSPKGYVLQAPEVAMRNRAIDDLKKYGSELGIGASSRTKIEVKKPDGAQSPLEEIRQRTRR